MSENELKAGSWVRYGDDAKAKKYWLAGFDHEGTPVIVDKEGDCVLASWEYLKPYVEPPKPVEAWAIVFPNGYQSWRGSEEEAKEYAAKCSEPVRVVHLVEAPAKDTPRVIEDGLTDFYVLDDGDDLQNALFDSYDDAQAYAKNHNRTVTVMRECHK